MLRRVIEIDTGEAVGQLIDIHDSNQFVLEVKRPLLYLRGAIDEIEETEGSILRLMHGPLSGFRAMFVVPNIELNARLSEQRLANDHTNTIFVGFDYALLAAIGVKAVNGYAYWLTGAARLANRSKEHIAEAAPTAINKLQILSAIKLGNFNILQLPHLV